MRRPSVRLAAGCALVAATAIMTSTALADPGNGNSANAPGQVKQEQQAAQPAAQQPTAQPQQAPAKPAKQTQAPGQAKQAAKASTASPGVKPANNTTKWTHCTTGTSSSGVSCTSSDKGHTPQGKADVSKQYGNGKTAAQIAVSRGGVGVQLTGPGNSQPHKVTLCGKPNNKSGGVDVHAVKSYDTSACQTQQQQVQPQTNIQVTHVCGETTIATSSTKVVGVLHGKHQHLMTNTHSAHFTKHNDTPVLATSTQAQVVQTGENCAPATVQPQATPPAAQATPPAAQATPPAAQVSVQAASQTQATGALPATQGQPASAAAPGGVLGAQTTLATPKPASHGGVLGTVTRVSGSSLPFTGFPLWIAVLIALALVAGGLTVRRHSRSAA